MTTVTTRDRVSEAALSVLKAATCNDTQIKLNSPKLDRGLYLEVNEVLERLGGKWKGGKVSAHIFPFDPSPLFQAVLDTGLLPAKNPLAFFPTPEPIVKEMIALAGDLDNMQVLEPSAGLGAIADTVKAMYPTARIDCVEVDDFRASILRAKGYTTACDDFLQYPLPEHYEVILMNPPFSVDGDQAADITHIEHAYKLLAPGGRLVAIASPGFTFRTQKRYTAFREFVEQNGGWNEVGEGAFKASGTGIKTVMLWLDKPEVSA